MGRAGNLSTGSHGHGLLRAAKARAPLGAIRSDTSVWRDRLLRDAHRAADPSLAPFLETKAGRYSPSQDIGCVMQGSDRPLSPSDKKIIEFFQECPINHLFRVDVNLAAIPVDATYDDVLRRSVTEIEKFARFFRRKFPDASFFFEPEWTMKRARDAGGYYSDQRWRVVVSDDTLIWHLHVHGVLYLPAAVAPAVLEAAYTRAEKLFRRSRIPKRAFTGEVAKSANAYVRRRIEAADSADTVSPSVISGGETIPEYYGKELGIIDQIKTSIIRGKHGKRSAFSGPRQVSVKRIFRTGETGRASFTVGSRRDEQYPDTLAADRLKTIEGAVQYCLKRHYRTPARNTPNIHFRTWLKLTLAAMNSPKMVVRSRLKSIRFMCSSCGEIREGAHHSCTHHREMKEPRSRMNTDERPPDEPVLPVCDEQSHHRETHSDSLSESIDSISKIQCSASATLCYLAGKCWPSELELEPLPMSSSWMPPTQHPRLARPP